MNNIGEEGCLHLANAKWAKLSKFYLSNSVERKIVITLEIRNAKIFRGPIRILPNYKFVRKD